MSATIDRYSKFIINANGTIFTPLFLTDYVSIAKFKELFYCDIALTTTGADGKSCIQGAVIKNSENYKMHNPNRLSHLCVSRNESGTINNYQLFNDGGLNTMGKGEILDVANEEGITDDTIEERVARAGDVAIKSQIKTSYYGNCKMFVEWLRDGATYEFTREQIGDVYNNNTIQIATKKLGIGIAGLYKLRLIVSNDEGEWASAIEHHWIYARKFRMKYGETLENAKASTIYSDIYIKEDAINIYERDGIGSVFYFNDTCTSPIEQDMSGYYIEGDNYYYYGSNIAGSGEVCVISNGRVSSGGGGGIVIPRNYYNISIMSVKYDVTANIITDTVIRVDSIGMPDPGTVDAFVSLMFYDDSDPDNMQILRETTIALNVTQESKLLSIPLYYFTENLNNLYIRLIDGASSANVSIHEQKQSVESILINEK